MDEEPRTQEWLAAAAGLALAHGRWCFTRRMPPDVCPYDPTGTLLQTFMAFHWFAGWSDQRTGRERNNEPRWAAFAQTVCVDLPVQSPDD